MRVFHGITMAFCLCLSAYAQTYDPTKGPPNRDDYGIMYRPSWTEAMKKVSGYNQTQFAELSDEEQSKLESKIREYQKSQDPIAQKNQQRFKTDSAKYDSLYVAQWKSIKGKVPTDYPYLDDGINIGENDIKKAKALRQLAKITSTGDFKVHYLNKLKEKNGGKLPSTLQYELKEAIEENKTRLKARTSYLKKLKADGRLKEKRDIQALKAFEDTGSIIYSNLVSQKLDDRGNLLNDEEKKLLKLYEEGKSDAEVYKHLSQKYDNLAKEKEKFERLSKSIIYDPKVLEQKADAAMERYNESFRITCGHPSMSHPAATWNKIIQQNNNRLKSQGKLPKGVNPAQPYLDSNQIYKNSGNLFKWKKKYSGFNLPRKNTPYQFRPNQPSQYWSKQFSQQAPRYKTIESEPVITTSDGRNLIKIKRPNTHTYTGTYATKNMILKSSPELAEQLEGKPMSDAEISKWCLQNPDKLNFGEKGNLKAAKGEIVSDARQPKQEETEDNARSPSTSGSNSKQD